MPAESVAQRQAMAIAEHHPGELYQRNRAMLKMTREQLHDFAATKQKGLPEKVPKKKKKPKAGEMSVAKGRKRLNAQVTRR
jgi:hypothetical protein